MAAPMHPLAAEFQVKCCRKVRYSCVPQGAVPPSNVGSTGAVDEDWDLEVDPLPPSAALHFFLYTWFNQ